MGGKTVAILMTIVLAGVGSSWMFPGGHAETNTQVGVQANTVLAIFDAEVPPDLGLYLLGYGVVDEEGQAAPWASVTTTNIAATVRHLQARSDVVHAYQPNLFILQGLPNDPYYAQQWGPVQANLPAAWDIEPGSAGIKIAILDGGVDDDHPDLAEAMCGPVVAVPTWGVGNEPHGTHVAGIAAASRNNSIGIAGTSAACFTMFRILVDDYTPGLKEQHIIDSIVLATASGHRIISLSMSARNDGLLGSKAPGLDDAIEAAAAAGVLMFAAAGNKDPGGCADPTSANQVIYPAKHAEVVAVGAIDSFLGRATDMGPSSVESACGPDLEVVAPGKEIMSTLPVTTSNPDGVGFESGTSMSTPMVSGIASLVWSANPALTRTQVRCILQETTLDLGPSGWDAEFGHGAVDAEAAVLAALALPGPCAQ